ncbi:MAG TPA: GNAT family N-acetyltransferase [Anaerolineales bacterium]|nr:GNAT family N-acetyltransferase [Anaerolineales bacterium]
MPEIEIRPATATDIPVLARLDHSYTSEYAWQMDVQSDGGQIGAVFHEIRLPRSVRVDYPRSPLALEADWQTRSGLLVARLNDEVVGYSSLAANLTPLTTWMTDLVVTPRLRRKGIGTALLFAAQEWVQGHSLSRRLILEMQLKNYPAIQLAQKLGFDFSGYNDHYFANRDIAIFFAKYLR